jgi:cytochrome c-type biogenesis protein
VIIAAASTQETLGRGIALLIAYSAGLGVPFLLAGLGLFKAFGRLKPYLRQVNIVSGALLALFGVLMLTGGLTQLSIWFSNLLSSVPWLEDLSTV